MLFMSGDLFYLCLGELDDSQNLGLYYLCLETYFINVQKSWMTLKTSCRLILSVWEGELDDSQNLKTFLSVSGRGQLDDSQNLRLIIYYIFVTAQVSHFLLYYNTLQYIMEQLLSVHNLLLLCLIYYFCDVCLQQS